MEKEIGIQVIGHIGHGTNSVIQELKNKEINVVVVDNHTHKIDDIFDLNGIKYAPIKIDHRKTNHASSKLRGVMAMASMIYLPYINELNGYGDSQFKRKLPDGIDIVKEYGLIQNKKSNLSKWERNMVVRIFKKNYYRVI